MSCDEPAAVELARGVTQCSVSVSHLALVACDGETVFGVDFDAMRSMSDFCRQLLPEDRSERVLKLDPAFADSTTLSFFATWVTRYATAVAPAIILPVPVVANPSALFPPWELEFLGRHVCPGFDPRHIACVYKLGQLATFLQVSPLSRLCLSLIAHFITSSVRNEGSPTAVVRGWVGKEGEYDADELGEMMSWMSEACQGMKLPRRTVGH